MTAASRRRPRLFFKISRSVRSSRFSLRSRASSSCSAVVSPVRPFVRSARACSTYDRSADGVRSRSRVTMAMVLPSSSTSRTAWLRNSSSNCRRGRRRVVSGIRDNRIHLSEDVHETGSSPGPLLWQRERAQPSVLSLTLLYSGGPCAESWRPMRSRETVRHWRLWCVT